MLVDTVPLCFYPLYTLVTRQLCIWAGVWRLNLVHYSICNMILMVSCGTAVITLQVVMNCISHLVIHTTTMTLRSCTKYIEIFSETCWDHHDFDLPEDTKIGVSTRPHCLLYLIQYLFI